MSEVFNQDIVDDEGRHIATVQAASADSVRRVLAADDRDDEGRSQWVWLRLANGDLVLGTFPQGDTYFTVSKDAP